METTMPGIDAQSIWRLLGYPAGPAQGARARLVEVRRDSGYTIEDIVLESRQLQVPGTLLRPAETDEPLPAILYCHAHGNNYDIGRRELVEGRPALLDAYGPALLSRGYAVLCIDMPGFGDRQAEGTETALSKAALWHGRTLMGDMLADLAAALDYLSGRDDVDGARIATLGLSMGATHAYMLAALDARVCACAHLCVFSNMQPLIEGGAHELHGPYMTVPGLLRMCDLADIAACIAPRPQLVCCGRTDPLTPPDALDPALDTLRSAYRKNNATARLLEVISDKTGHVETPAMRKAVLRLLNDFV
ncbi:alpha/beta hydrolase family protein [Hoeflea sp.]|uniref:alpha/beta hydrolase family protein n=1 Tax=Hoeflea sp. TaxID=1940281 RepID=UPI003B01BF7E